MGTNFFNAPKAYRTPSIRNVQSATNVGRSASNSAGNAAQKSLANAEAMGRAMKLTKRKKV